MRRFTYRDSKGKACIDIDLASYKDNAEYLINLLIERLAQYEETRHEPSEINDILVENGNLKFRVNQLEFLGENACFPVNIGDTVFVVAHGHNNGKLMQCSVTSTQAIIWVSSEIEPWGGAFTLKDFGKTIFKSTEVMNK